MCGICGHFSVHDSPSQDNLLAMTYRLEHRGPDHLAIYVDGPIGLGHTRLSIIDLSSAGHQPMHDAETGNIIVYNGEIYNYQILRQSLIRQGYKFQSNTDTEVVFKLYDRDGVECLKRLRGMFAFAIWDRKRQRLFLARDRLGQKPLVYSKQGDKFLFASEIQALANHPGVSKEIDLDALDLYLAHQFIPAPWTIYRDIRKLPPAHYMLVDWKNNISIHRYWQLDYTKKIDITEEEAIEETLARLRDAVRLRLISDVPLGALLSGGVDSSLVVSLMSQLSGEPVRTFSIGFDEDEFNELPYARTVANLYQTKHHEEIIHADILEILPKLAHHYGEPYADKSAVPSFYVSQMARQHVTVALNGDGGDELCAGYSVYNLPMLTYWFSRLPVAIRQRLTAPYSTSKSRLLRKWYNMFLPESRVLDYKAFWTSDARSNLYNEDVRFCLDKQAYHYKRMLLSTAHQHSNNIIDAMLWIGNNAYLPDDLLVKMDIASMAHSLEARSPFLDHELVEFCATLPANLKVRGGQTKYLLKKIGERFLPEDILYRPKQGFSLPVSKWLRGSMKDFVKDMLIDNAKGVTIYFNPKTIRKIFEAHLSGREEHGYRLWCLLNFEMWYVHAYKSRGCYRI